MAQEKDDESEEAWEKFDALHTFMTDDVERFRQIDYLWLFNNELKFDERQGFELDDSSITVKDYERMRLINRQELTRFLKEKHDGMMNTDDGKEFVWADERLDEEIKKMLSHYERGADIPLDMVCHMEYFYNTLDCHFKAEDPFKSHEDYPALQFREEDESAEKTLYAKHK